MDTIKYLIMRFRDANGSTRSIRVQNPKDNLTELQVQTAMQTIIDKDVFKYNLSSLVSAISASIITTTTEDILS